jgi:hypothetical protein
MPKKRSTIDRKTQPPYLQQAHKAIDTLASWHTVIAAYLQRIPRNIWIFPILLCLIVLTLTALRISGTSIGVYSQINGETDSSMLAGNPRGVRSDEWLVTSQMTIAQAANDYEKINDNIAKGQNMALLDVPYKDWSTFFKPQNLAFFVLPLEYAFAFKWWFLFLVLILACYFFILEVFSKSISRAALFATFIGLSPMVFWWWTSGTLLTIAYSFIIALLALRLIKAQHLKQRVAYTGLLSYVLVCFALLLYPPFQIPCLIVVATFIVGWVLSTYKGKAQLKPLLRLWPYALMVVVVPALIGLAFYKTNQGIIDDITHTSYPGARVVTSGGTYPLLAVSSFLSPNLEYDNKAASGYLGNQSEASNFMFIAPYLFLPSLYLIIRAWRRHDATPWGLLLINLLILVFLVRMYIDIPILEPLYRPLLLDKVPNVRLLIGLGLAGALQLLLLIKTMETSTLKKTELLWLSVFGGLSSFIAMLLIGNYTIDHFPVFIASFGKVVIFSACISLAIFLILRRFFIAGLIILASFSFFSVYRIHPLYQGLAPVSTSKTISTLRSYPDKGSWVVLEDRLLINFPMMADKDSLSGIQFAPQLDLWKQLDPTGQYKEVYNRYAHVLFVDDKKMDTPLTLKHADLFVVKFDPCTTFIQKNVTYALSPKLLTDTSCAKLDKTITLPAKQLYIYKVTTP